ncbi:hypothetical protein AB0C34_21425 [Nocardia sp. NPDC049220]|uniref:hypothetical protein n=1 Tax=Nocardia sp. NPDC049220 TaxID=3155273 RepID=UPI0033C3EEB2
MSDTTGIQRLPPGIRLLRALLKEPDCPTMTTAELTATLRTLTRTRVDRRAAAQPRLAHIVGNPLVSYETRHGNQDRVTPTSTPTRPPDPPEEAGWRVWSR